MDFAFVVWKQLNNMSAHALTEGIIAVWGSLIRRFPKKHTQKNRYKTKL